MSNRLAHSPKRLISVERVSQTRNNKDSFGVMIQNEHFKNSPLSNKKNGKNSSRRASSKIFVEDEPVKASPKN